MAAWVAVAVLPNIQLQEPIEGGPIAFVPATDERVSLLVRAHRRLAVFLDRFSDAFDQKICPSVLLRHRSRVGIANTEALSGFRDLVALSVIPYSRAYHLRFPGRHRIYYSDSFWIYPWTLGRDNRTLVIQTPAQLGMHDLRIFHGQSQPEIPHFSLSPLDIDRPLLDALVNRWRVRYLRQRPQWQDLALFRSLNMAYRAAQIPAGADATAYDDGRSIALWISALEILVHPGAGGKANRTRVCSLISSVQWENRTLGHRRYQMPNDGSRASLPIWLCGQLYDARNDFMHGNPISRASLAVRGTRRRLSMYAAPVYRLALTAFLSLYLSRPSGSLGAAEIGEHVARSMSFSEYQSIIERSLLTAKP